MNNKNPVRSGQEVTTDELKSCILEVMDELDRFCRDNNIRYFLVGGTLLGAVRHKGFIPWDDDIDVAMLREDYEKFCKLFHSKNGYVLKCIHKAPEIGAYVDIFPLDYIEKDSLKVATFYGNSIIKKLEDLKYMQLRKDRPLWKNALILAGRLLCFRSLPKIAKDRERRALAVAHSEPTEWITSLHGAWGIREIVTAQHFAETTEYSFEGRRYLGPVDADTYLTSIYGDYMTPPPEDKRENRHQIQQLDFGDNPDKQDV